MISAGRNSMPMEPHTNRPASVSYTHLVYAIGSNRTASQFSGVKVGLVRFTVYALVGVMAAVAALVLTSRMDSTRPNVATGYELDVIAMVVLGGVSSLGGKGRMGGR